MRLPTFEEAASRAVAEKVERPAVPVGAVSEGRVRGEAEDPVQAGELCVKGPMMAQLVTSRFRLTRPT